MSNLILLFWFSLIGVISFVIGLLTGFLIRNTIRNRLLLNQNRGEASVRKLITSNFNSTNFHLLNNITIPFQDGTTQIDHILISTKGVFIIETKHYSGWIYANEKSNQWMQVFYRIKNQFQNPIRQNYRHIKAIQQLLEFLPKEQIHSLVIFSGKAIFKTPIPKGVFYLEQLKNHLLTFQEDVITQNRMEFCVGRLECKRYELTRATDIQHRAYLEKKYNG